MKKRSLFFILFAAICCFATYAQQHEDPDMTAYRQRNANRGGIKGWIPQDGLGPAVNVHSTGASIGGGGNYHSNIQGWHSQDGLGPVVNVHSTGANIGGGGNYHANIQGWHSQDGLGPVVNTNHNNNSHWGGNSNSNSHWQGINPGISTPNWNNNNNWNNNWNNSNWGGGISSSPIIVNNYYNPNYWWRDLRNPPAYSPISWGGYNYYYHDGNFFNILNGIYQVVLPAIGLILQTLPSGATQVTNYNNYYSYHGVFYKYTGNGYRVVTPPLGACLPSIPYFAQKVTINGVTCYKYDNVYIEPIYDNYDGDYCYRVVASVY